MANASGSTDQIFEELVPAPLAAVHHHLTELHRLSAEACSVLAAAHRIEGLNGARTIHLGSGFGADVRLAQLWGASSVRALESGAGQVQLAKLLTHGDEAEIRAALVDEPATQTLYPASAVKDVARQLVAERQAIQHLKVGTAPDYVLLDLLSEGAEAALGEEPGDVAMGNLMLHWLMMTGRSPASVLDLLSAAVRPGGVAVFSLPYHFVQTARDDSELRSKTLFENPLYRDIVKGVAMRVQPADRDQGSIQARPGSLSPLLISDAALREGSSHMKLLGVSTRFFFAPRPSLELRGAILYHLTFLTGLPARTLASHIREVVEERTAASDLAEVLGTFVRFYVYRRS